MEADRIDFEIAKTHILDSSGVALAGVAMVTLMPNEIRHFEVLSIAFVATAGSLISSLFRVTFSSLGIRRPGWPKTSDGCTELLRRCLSLICLSLCSSSYG